MATATPVVIPAHFLKLINDYGFADTRVADKIVASRSASGWFAVLVQDGENNFWAIDFKYYGPGESPYGCQRVEGWEIQNDDAGSFESISEFKNCKLTTTLF